MSTSHRPFYRPLVTLASTALLSLALTACKGDKKPDAGAESGKVTTSAEDIAEGDKIFNTFCISCHSVGAGPRIGPDLHNVEQRRDRDWLVKWMKDPIGMGQTDEVGKQLFAEWKSVPMPNPNLNDKQIAQVLAYMADTSAKIGDTPTGPEPIRVLTEPEFAQAKDIYFNRCSGCHGTLRKGATGPTIEPKRTREITTGGIKAILTSGLPGGMPAWGRLGILSDAEIDLMAAFVQAEVPVPPKHDFETIKATWKLDIPLADRPTEPQTKRDWDNYFGVILRDAGQVAIIDGDTKELIKVIDTGFAVHILRSSSTGRYFYVVGRDGKVTLIDLWPEIPQVVASVRGCLDARSVDGSKFEGYEDKYVIEGCYWPTQYVVFDGLTLEPLEVVSVEGNTFDTDEKLDEIRVASIIASHHDPLWAISLKESGHVAIVDYSKPGFPMVSKIGAALFLHDGGWDKTKRYFLVAANMSNKMAVIDVEEQKLVTTIETGNKPHPGRGANWEDPEFGWVNATTHIGEGKLSIYGADPERHPEHAWKVVREVVLDTSGSLFVKTHDNSPWVWYDSPLSNEDEKTRRICVYSKKEGKTEKCWTPFTQGRAVHFEYNKAGDELWVSGWHKEGELVIYDDKTLEEKHRIKADWLVTPTGKFNVHNTARDVY